MNSILVTGYSAAPAGTSMHSAFGHCGVVLEIDIESGEIQAAEFTVITSLANDFLARLVVGYPTSLGMGPLSETIRTHYHAPSANAFIMALKSAFQRYQSWQSCKQANE